MNDFDEFWRILCDAFPESEHRNREGQRVLLDHPLYKLNFIRENNRILGFWSVWRLDPFQYIEHLALDSSCRGKGYGTRLLEQVFRQAAGPLILEVERPDTEEARRRIVFYERLGLHLNRYDYFQPPLQPGYEPVPMYLMSWPEPLGQTEFNAVRKELYAVVYGISIVDSLKLFAKD